MSARVSDEQIAWVQTFWNFKLPLDLNHPLGVKLVRLALRDLQDLRVAVRGLRSCLHDEVGDPFTVATAKLFALLPEE